MLTDIYYYYINFLTFCSSGISKGVDQDLKRFIPVKFKSVHTRKNTKKRRESLFPIQNSTDGIFSVALV